jgi:protein-S-isoprenylcysteine O-methyltransferase Ste14
MISLFFRNLFFTILQPGVVAGLIPWLILNKESGISTEEPYSIWQFSGIILFVFGLMVLLICIARFGFEGKGTLSPLDPTKKLVIAGLYKFSRNPMYVGVMLILAAEALFFQSVQLLVYSLFILCAFQAFIIFREEPRLLKDFGEEYKSYKRRVRRWI